jgi:photosystem II stability/assembly factor-like uncharacterized protein
MDPNVQIMQGVVVFKIAEGVRLPAGELQKTVGTIGVRIARAGVRVAHSIVPADMRLTKEGGTGDPMGIARIYLGALAETADPWAVAASLSRLPGVEYAEPKYLQQLYDTPNDPLVSAQSDILTRLNAFNGWSIAKGSPSVVIATVDGGTDWRHEDLIGNVRVSPAEDVNHNGVFDSGDNNGVDDDGNGFVDDVVGWNFATKKNDPTGSSSTPQSAAHGTATASHFGGATNNAKGLAGSSWNCALLPICVASPTSDNSIAFGYEGIVYAYRNGAKVINCSWGAQGGVSRFQQDVIDAATAAGALVVAAGGNSGLDNDISPHYPSSYRNVLSVGGLNSSDNGKAWFSNYGVSVPVYSPSVSVLSALVGGGYGDGGSGTSYASSLTAGLAGILYAAHPTWTPVQIAAQLRSTADPVDADNVAYSGKMGHGRLNLARALTESHPVLNVVGSQLRTTKGDSILLPGDTILYSVHVQNVLFNAATNVLFSVSTSDAALQVLDGSASLASLAPGQTAALPVLRLLVGSITSSKRVAIRLDWSINGGDRDAAITRAVLLPTKPTWYLEPYSGPAEMFSVRAVSREIVWVAGGDRNGTNPLVVRSTDGGKNWSEVTSNLPLVDLYCVAAVDANRAWVGSGDGRIFATTDGGMTWSQQAYPGTKSPFINGIWFFPDGRGYAMGDPPATGRFIVLKSTDWGSTWTHLSSEPTGSSTEAGWNNSFWWTDPDHGWFGSNKGHIWKTTDGGNTWSSPSSGGTNSYGVAFASSSNGYAIHDAGYIARTTDGGVTWGSASSPTTDQCYGVSVAPLTPSAWILTSLDMFRSRDTGLKWGPEALYPFSGALSHLSMVDTTVGWAVTSNGEILKYAPAVVTDVADGAAEEIPAVFSLSQNYPNPFNPLTVISCQVPVASWVRLEVFDILGRKAATLLDEQKEPRMYHVTFDASGLASGVYLYRLTAGSYVASRKMLLLR